VETAWLPSLLARAPLALVQVRAALEPASRVVLILCVLCAVRFISAGPRSYSRVVEVRCRSLPCSHRALQSKVSADASSSKEDQIDEKGMQTRHLCRCCSTAG
jgi:hypothetical protein